MMGTFFLRLHKNENKKAISLYKNGFQKNNENEIIIKKK